MPPRASCHIGVGLRPVHYEQLLAAPRTQVRWFEAVSENFMDSRGRPLRVLESIRREHPVALHGVAMSIGSVEGVRPGYLASLRDLIDRIDPFLVSDHLCWTGLRRANLHDLLPLPFTREAMALLVARVQAVQEALGRRLLLENVSSYLRYSHSEMAEWEFLAELSRRSGCAILLDVNNVYVSAKNHGFDPQAYLDGIPAQAIGQVHLAGHVETGTHLFDTHSRPVSPQVWELFSRLAARLPEQTPVLVEWDEDIPPWERLEEEAIRAKEAWADARRAVAA